MSSSSNEKNEITVSVTKDGQTAKAVLSYDQIKEVKDLYGQDLIEMTIDTLRLEIERGI